MVFLPHLLYDDFKNIRRFTMSNNATSPIKTAHFRFALIAPVIQGIYLDASASAYFRRVTEHPLTLPDGTTFHYNPKTLEKWAQLYKNGGMDALMPKERVDKGSTRTLSDVAIEKSTV